MKFKKRALGGLRWAAAVIIFLVFAPPVIAPWLPAWEAAHELAAKDGRLRGACGEPSTLKISRWFYTYRFSGDVEHAVFRGSVNRGECERSFRVRIDRSGGPWRVSGLEIESS